MGQLTSEKRKAIMKSHYAKYYDTYFHKYGKVIDFYIKKFFISKRSKSKSKSTSSMSHKKSITNEIKSHSYESVNESMRQLAAHSINEIMKQNMKITKESKSKSKSQSRDFIDFMYDLIYRRILIYECRDYIYNHIQNDHHFMNCLKDPADYKRLKFINSGEYGSVYRLLNDQNQPSNKCIKFVNITATLNNLKYINFLKEMEISKIAGNIGVGPVIYDAYICVNDADSTCYGIIYMEYLEGITLSKYMDQHLLEDDRLLLKKLIHEKIAKLHQHHILHSDLHADNVFIILDQKRELSDVKIIDYGFSQYIQDYIYFRNHYRLNEDLFHFSRHYMYHELANIIYQKITQNLS